MRVLLVGYGSIGRRHLANLGLLGVEEVAVFRTGKGGVPEHPHVEVHTKLDRALDARPDAVLIANPTALHVPVALDAAKRGCHLLMEKPVSDRLEGLDELADIVARDSLVVLVGYVLRFHPVLRRVKKLLGEGRIGDPLFARVEVGQYLPDWRPGQDYRKSYSASKSMGGGALLDLSHELDYVQWLLGPPEAVIAMQGRLGGLDIETEDTVAIVMRLASGGMAEVHLDYLQRPPVRAGRIVGTDGTIVFDLLGGSVKLHALGDREATTFPVEIADVNGIYVEEMRHFIACVEGRETPLVRLQDGVRVLRTALMARESATAGRAVYDDEDS